MQDLPGYHGAALALLTRAKASVGDVLEVNTDWGSVTGTLVPRYEFGDDSHVVLKLSTGYNVGLKVEKSTSVLVKARGERPAFNPPRAPKARGDLPRVPIIGTGGTIASRIDYRTGAVTPAVSAEELHALIPELSEIARVEPEILFNVLSENMRPSNWSELAKRVRRAVKDGASGVVVTHGTDTLGYTSAALSFALKGIPIPVVLVAAQRSSDRPSSDATLNLIGGVSAAATADFAGVFVAMHLDENDDRIAFHRGTRVRKNHTSRRDAFLSVGVPLAAVWGRGGFEHVDEGLQKRGAEGFSPKTAFDERVVLLKFYPSMPPGHIDALAGSGVKGVVIEGTGLGHTSDECIVSLKRFVDDGGLAFMTSQCVNGRVDLNVYDTGRDLLRAGVTPLEDMLSETALVKAMWALGNSKTREEALSLMLEDVAGETTLRTFLK